MAEILSLIHCAHCLGPKLNLQARTSTEQVCTAQHRKLQQNSEAAGSTFKPFPIPSRQREMAQHLSALECSRPAEPFEFVRRRGGLFLVHLKEYCCTAPFKQSMSIQLSCPPIFLTPKALLTKATSAECRPCPPCQEIHLPSGLLFLARSCFHTWRVPSLSDLGWLQLTGPLFASDPSPNEPENQTNERAAPAKTASLQYMPKRKPKT